MKNEDQPIILFWFRRDLRLHDNRGLYEALTKPHRVLPVFIFDKNILRTLTSKKDKRISFIHETLENLNKVLKKSGSSLFIIHDEPLAAIKTICKSYHVREVITNHDYEPYAIQRDLTIATWLKSKNISFVSFKDQVNFERSEVMKADGTPYTVFTPYANAWKQRLKNEKIKSFRSEKFLKNLLKTKPFHFPLLNEIGFEKTKTGVPQPSVDKKIITNYDKTRNLLAVNGTSKLSVHLRFGSVSIRKLTKLALELNEQWLNELIWREFFMMILFHFPHVVTKSFKKKYDHLQWRNDEREFELWCNGSTGYPIVDAAMHELNETGLMHNRARMIVAGFLTKHLLIDWRWGEAYFAEKLLDYELSSNNGNWQWAAGSGCDAAPYFRIFNPAEQTKKFDPELRYVKKWIKNFSPDYLSPVVEHDFARKRALEVYKKSLTSIP